MYILIPTGRGVSILQLFSQRQILKTTKSTALFKFHCRKDFFDKSRSVKLFKHVGFFAESVENLSSVENLYL